MGAGEVAKLAQIELKDICAFAMAGQIAISQGSGEKLTGREVKFRNA